MSKTLLKIFSIEVIVQFVVDYLLSTIKNEDSVGALRIRKIMTTLRSAVESYFHRFPENPSF